MILEAEVINDELLEAELLAGFNSDMSIPDGYIKPEGTLEITTNGTFDVTKKAEVKVNVPTSALKISQIENMLILR